MPDLRHHCSYRPSEDCVLTYHNFWMVPDMVPTRSVQHRFIIYKKPCKSLSRDCKFTDKDKGTWKCSYTVVLYVINVGETVFERN